MSKFLKGVEVQEKGQNGETLSVYKYFIPCLTGNGEPTRETEGAVGSLYMNIDNGDMYKCVFVDDGDGYQWTLMGDSTNGAEFAELLISGSDEPIAIKQGDPISVDPTYPPYGNLCFGYGQWGVEVRLTGIADGENDWDAVNMKQLNTAMGDISSALAELHAYAETLKGGDAV